VVMCSIPKASSLRDRFSCVQVSCMCGLALVVEATCESEIMEVQEGESWNACKVVEAESVPLVRLPTLEAAMYYDLVSLGVHGQKWGDEVGDKSGEPGSRLQRLWRARNTGS
jgi:hypothetical protein